MAGAIPRSRLRSRSLGPQEPIVLSSAALIRKVSRLSAPPDPRCCTPPSSTSPFPSANPTPHKLFSTASYAAQLFGPGVHRLLSVFGPFTAILVALVDISSARPLTASRSFSPMVPLESVQVPLQGTSHTTTVGAGDVFPRQMLLRTLPTPTSQTLNFLLFLSFCPVQPLTRKFPKCLSMRCKS